MKRSIGFLQVPRKGGLVALGLALLAVQLLSRPAAAQLANGDPTMKFEFKDFVMPGSLDRPTDIAFLPDGRTVITQRPGAIAVRLPNGDLNVNAGRPPGTVNSGPNEQGLLGVVVSPSFAQDKSLFFYVSNGNTAANRHRVYRATIGDDNRVTFVQTPIIENGLEGPANHNGGGMVIHGNHLYVAVGDTGANATPPRNKYGSCLNKANGKILRVGLDGSIPTDNPLTSMAMVTGCDSVNGDFGMREPDKRIFAWGLRNPFRLWVDPRTSLMWVGDVGEGSREEISVGGKGTHFGYPFWEGKYDHTGAQPAAFKGACKGMVPSTECTSPTFDYNNNKCNQHGTCIQGQQQGNENCVIGGLIPYDACGWPDEYKSKYFYADHGSGRMYTLNVNAQNTGVMDGSRTLFATVGPVASIRMGHNASLYAVIVGRGEIKQIQPRNLPQNCMVNMAPPPPPDAGAPADAAVADAAARDGAPTLDASGSGGASGGTGGAGGMTSGTGGTTGGTGGRGGSSGGAGGMAAGGAGGDDDPDGMPAGGSGDGGCGCTTSGKPGPGTALFLVAVVVLALRSRRRR